MDSGIKELAIAKLEQGLPAITPAFGAALAEACAVCLNDQGHTPGVEITVKGDFTAVFKLYWQEVTDQMLRCWNDSEYTTEQAAYGIAFLVIQELTDYTIIQRSRQGTGFDYWLGKKTETNELLFQNALRLEVSGIRKGDDSRVKTRVKLKVEQVCSRDKALPAYIAIIEFSKPLAFIVKK
ncbi:MAG TPA: hypothetical protein DEG17_02235 [Cyanobacteria bacterium UBA11149]|nr:hypothetical protein [Cyanobacteria bacterium UBA11367]HBE60220.1 hypothetical protein [Cyanobacteria bacterium UBA11366]HBK63306.1 hypothetical protein [Cyanobacteria bacterium UBA11166]HBR74165.1 hypothetical protein [Cyanobacteria bacterium UBA11159]HBS71189.1 hypothetical protein [Cyanobacteria bacterium UBA11153]HBW87724.1 hypothetical protein [Cyanobacteria bacterium UBA11149]HCA96580.1 hypothetical protein [Cyanobacteria bacterium UBA9226]